jgi:diguanylate cyclase (GGDEF)-like protein
MMKSLDTISIAFMGMLIGTALAVLMLFNWQVQKKQPGVAYWAAAFVLCAASSILTTLRTVAPLWLSALLLNLCLHSLWLMFWIGFRRFVGIQGKVIVFALSSLALYLGLIFYFLYGQPSLSARVIIFCCMRAFYAGLCAKVLLQHGYRNTKANACLLAGWACVFHAGFSVFRIFQTLRADPLTDLLQVGGIQALDFIEGNIFSLVLGVLLLIMSSQRLQGELESQQEALEKIASTDILSETGNRRHFLETATREIERARRYRRPLSLIMLDIDHFKNINDTHGHEYGDAVIKSLGQMLSVQARESDTVCRIGGEEFAILMPETTLDAAALVAIRLQAILNTTPMAETEKQKIFCTASMGLAELADDDTNIYDLLPRADQSMYQAKREGRNRIVTQGPRPVRMDCVQLT